MDPVVRDPRDQVNKSPSSSPGAPKIRGRDRGQRRVQPTVVRSLGTAASVHLESTTDISSALTSISIQLPLPANIKTSAPSTSFFPPFFPPPRIPGRPWPSLLTFSTHVDGAVGATQLQPPSTSVEIV
ncbi:hypothetical protein ACEPAF_5315 [Sanghuangporus sanghuang]